jgi:DNA polymerase elongation subunit (family B)
MSELSTTKKVIRKPNVKKYFRLFDFNTYDEVTVSDDASSGSDNESHKFKRKVDDKIFVIQMFGVNESGETCCIYIKDFQPFFFIKVGNNWQTYDAVKLVRDIQSKIDKKYQDSIVSYELVEYNKLYGFTAGKKDKFVQLTFKNTEVMNKVKNLWYTYVQNKIDPNIRDRKRTKYFFQGISLDLYESGTIPPLLRYFHIHNISPSGWVSFYLNKIIRPPVNTTTCTFEYICPLSSLMPEPSKMDRVPFKICSFDIEASSSHGDFPVPVKTYKRLAANVVDAFSKQSQFLDEAKGKMLLQKIILTAFGYDHFQDIDIVYPKSKPSKERVKHLINILMDETIENAKRANTEEDNSLLLRIDDMFESMNETQNQGSSENASDEILVVDSGNSIDDSDDEETNTIQNKSFKSQKKTSKDNTKIVDILMNSSTNKDDPKRIARDEKIQITNDVLTRLFPRLEGDKVTFIGSTFLKYGEMEPYLNHCIVLGSCDPVEGAVIDPVENEKTLLLNWAELIQKENPDIIIGYNIFGFDYEFLFRRAEENECVHDFMMLSRQIGEVAAKPNRDMPGKYDIETTKMAIASGEYELRYFKMIGRLQIDMYASFRRDFILSSYKLDDVAGLFISDDIKRVEHVVHPQYGDVTELYSQNLMGINVNDFIHIELSGYTSEYHKKGQKFRILDIQRGKEVTEIVKGQEKINKYNVLIIGGHEHFEKGKSIKWGMAKDDVSPKDIFRLANGSSSDRSIVAKYCIQDCNLVHHLMNKIDSITGYSEMANICCVPISFLIFRGQGIKLTSFVAKKCLENNMLMPDLEKSNDFDRYEGAIVLPPKCAMYIDNPVACVDYSSLYPSSMISQNYSHDSLVWSKEYDLDGKLIKEKGERDSSGKYIYDNLSEYQYIDIEFDNFKYIKIGSAQAKKTKVGKIVCRWAQLPNNKKSILPSILEELLKARSDTRKLIKSEKDPFMQNILDKRQLAYKVTANSLYGQCGSRTSTFYEKNVAASTTATGRMMITYAKRIIEEVYGDRIFTMQSGETVKTKAEYIYGDTDSVFFTFNLENPNTGEKIVGKPALEMTIELAQDAAKLCTQWLKPPMELSYEKTLMPFILLSKKRYVGMLYEEDPNKGKLKYMGLPLKRRDSCDYMKDVYGGILDILMKSTDMSSAIKHLDDCLNNLIAGKVSMDKLAITKALRSDYKNPEQIGHNVLAQRIGKRDPGNKPKSGDRIKFVFIVNDDKKALQGEKMETPEFIIENKLPIDYNHYITNQIMKPLLQLFGLELEKIMRAQNKGKVINAIKDYQKQIKKLEEEYPDLEIFMKKKEKYCASKVKALLFDKVLEKIHNEKNGIQTITSFFSRGI